MKRLSYPAILVIVLLVALIVVAGVQQGGLPKGSSALAGAGQNVSGYAWSSNIGWISFNCTNDNSCGTSDYGVNIDNGGNFSGYAWSPSVGLISFNVSSGCPEAGCVTQPKFDKSTGVVTGWARACEGTVNGDCTGASRSDGWDGWIKLSGTTPDGNAYGPLLTDQTFVGYSWGSDVIGWLAWSGSGYGVISPANIVCHSSISASPDTVEQGQNVLLTWSVTGGPSCATSCTGSGFNTGGATTGTNVPSTVPPTPPTTSYALTCTGGHNPPPVNTTVTVLIPTVQLTVNGQSKTARVNPDAANNTTVAWSSTNATSCSVTKNSAAWKTGLSSAGTVDTVTAQTTYAIDCVNSHDTHATASVTVNVTPGFNEF